MKSRIYTSIAMSIATILLLLVIIRCVKCGTNNDSGVLINCIIKDSSGKNYEVHLLSKSKEVADISWAGAEVGDILYLGNFKICIKSSCIKYNIYDLEIDQNIIINIDRGGIFVLRSNSESMPDLICLETFDSSNIKSLYSFYLDNGKPVAIDPILYTLLLDESTANELVILKYIGYLVDSNTPWYLEKYSLDLSLNRLGLISKAELTEQEAISIIGTVYDNQKID